MKKSFAAPSIEIKKFNRASVIALSGEATNAQSAETDLRNMGIDNNRVNMLYL